MPGETIVKDASARMRKTSESTNHELGAVRTGKATPALLDHIRVDVYGASTPLNQVASITSPDPRTLVVQPWDKNLVGEVVKGLQQGDLGLNPQVDAEVIRLPIPALNEERRQELVKRAKKVVEEGKVAVRNIRRDANDHLKKLEKDKELTNDQMHDAINEVQKLTDDCCKQLDDVYVTKEKEVMEV
ncbi:ribosome recycling factor [Gemmatimonas aurantiaca]|nr:ribosome recycling factor [Gemmatimonas aurantiaca]